VPDRVKSSSVIFDIQTLTFSREHQSAWMSKITNDGLTRSGTGCFLARCSHMATVSIKELEYRQNGTNIVGFSSTT